MGMKRLEECSVLRPNVAMLQLSCRISSVAAEAAIALEITRLDRQFREVQMKLAHANRVATMGQLTASIVHEVNRPITATMTNAQAALRFLDAQVVDLNEVRQILNDTVKDGNRAGEVISRIRDLIKKAPPRREGCEISGAIREVIELSHESSSHVISDLYRSPILDLRARRGRATVCVDQPLLPSDLSSWWSREEERKGWNCCHTLVQARAVLCKRR
jgi:C4-dicarboxylate-specific signal transduction histidine kinase